MLLPIPVPHICYYILTLLIHAQTRIWTPVSCTDTVLYCTNTAVPMTGSLDSTELTYTTKAQAGGTPSQETPTPSKKRLSGRLVFCLRTAGGGFSRDCFICGPKNRNYAENLNEQPHIDPFELNNKRKISSVFFLLLAHSVSWLCVVRAMCCCVSN